MNHEASRYVGVIRRTIYGTSGTELPPPVIKRESVAYLSSDIEDLSAFSNRMSEIGLRLRRNAESLPRPSYGQRDGIDWEIVPICDRIE